MNSLKFLLAALNTKYIHSNPGIYSLYSYSVKRQPSLAEYIGIAEYTINNQKGEILADIYKRRPDAVGFSCYIWNIEMIREIIKELKKLLPDTDIWVGGPEVTYDAGKLLAEMPELTGVMVGEGEATFYDVLRRYLDIVNIHNTGKSYDIGNACNTGNSCGIENFRDTGGFRDIDGLVLGKEKILFVRSQEDLPICRSFHFCIMTWTLLKIRSFIMRAAEAVRSGAVIVCHRLTNGFGSAILIW